MVRRERDTDLLVQLESAVGRQQHDRRGLERIFWREYNPSMVQATCELGVWRPTYRTVPVEEILLGRLGRELG